MPFLTPLEAAFPNGKPDYNAILRQAKSSEFRISFKDVNKRTYLMMAVKAGDLFLTKLFLACGTDANAQAKNGLTPLKLAAKHPQELAESLTDLLLAYGAKDTAIPKDVDTEGTLPLTHKSSALHVAAEMGNKPVCIKLVRNGSNRASRDFRERTPADCARENNHGPLAEQLADQNDSEFSNSEITLDVAVRRIAKSNIKNYMVKRLKEEIANQAEKMVTTEMRLV